ncbi:MAG: DUF2339 domain-containing protein [Bacteriovoracaceae bacterium]|nr:DUF2339 domain-containing protein [Bacteriovoracaceae bacterium]
MEENGQQSILNEINALKDRLQKLEEIIFPVVANQTPPPLPISEPIYNEMKVKENPKPSNVLGYVGAGCLLFAIVLLIKFSIDSGWLTPVRQMVLATLFGLSLIFVPAFNKIEDRTYFSILPAAGIAILHLTIYGCVFYHLLFSPLIGLIGTALVSVMSLWLLSKFKEETFAIMAAAGTYLGAVLLKDSFSSLNYFSIYLLAWNCIYAATAIKLKIRSIIVLCAYFSLFLVVVVSISSQADLKWPVVLLQTIQMIIFSLATLLYTVKNEAKLTLSEAQQFFPVYLFFYGHVFYILDKINPYFATAFAVIFSVSLLVLLQTANSKLSNEKLNSAPVIYLFISVILAHAIFFVAMNDIFRYATVACILIAFSFSKRYPIRPEFNGVTIILALVTAYGILSLSFSQGSTPNLVLVFFGFLYGVIAIYNSEKSRIHQEIILGIAHSQFIIGIYRLKEIVGEYGVPQLWTVYAFIILYRGMKQQDATTAKSVFPVIFIAIAYFVFNSFGMLGQGQRIISLLIIGGLVYACGYFYRKINTVSAKG